MRGIDLARWPFRSAVAISIGMSVLQALLQMRWAAMRYRTAQMFIGTEVLLLMLIVGVGLIRICDEERTRLKMPYILGIVLTFGTWITASFLLS